jgi:hypothetical protein
MSDVVSKQQQLKHLANCLSQLMATEATRRRQRGPEPDVGVRKRQGNRGHVTPSSRTGGAQPLAPEAEGRVPHQAARPPKASTPSCLLN